MSKLLTIQTSVLVFMQFWLKCGAGSPVSQSESLMQPHHVFAEVSVLTVNTNKITYKMPAFNLIL